MFYTLGVTCPYCLRRLGVDVVRCQHVVARRGVDGTFEVVGGVALPGLMGAGAGRQWSEVEVAEAFGELAPVVDAYEIEVGRSRRGRMGTVRAEVLWRVLVAVMDASVEGLEDGNGTVFWCAADPLRATAEARALVGLLRQGYEYLMERADARDAREGSRQRVA